MDFDPYVVDDIRILSKLKAAGFDPRVVYDIGSSNGFWTEAVARLFPTAEFHLFEPAVDLVPEYRPYLEGVISRHNKNLRLHRFALGDKNGTIQLWLSPGGLASSTLNVGPNAFFPTKAEVPIKTLDAAVADLKLPAPQFMKIDVQATEDKILRGAVNTLRTVDFVEIECWWRKSYGPETPLVSQITEFMDANGFSLVETGYAYYTDDGKLEAVDCYFLRDDLCKKWKSTLPQHPW